MVGWNVHLSRSTNGHKSFLWRLHNKKKTLSVPGWQWPVFSVHLMSRALCASKTNMPAVVRSKKASSQRWWSGKSFWECKPGFFFFFHGQKVGCFSDQANKHLWSPCTVCKTRCGGLQNWARQGAWLQGASRPGEVIKLIASFNRWGLFPWGLRCGLFIFLVTAT